MKVRTGPFLHLYSDHPAFIFAFLCLLHRFTKVAQNSARTMVSSRVLKVKSRRQIMQNKNGLRGRETVGSMERECKWKKRGREKHQFPVETPTFPMSSCKPERSLIQYLVHMERKGAHNVSAALRSHWGAFGCSCKRFKTKHITDESFTEIKTRKKKTLITTVQLNDASIVIAFSLNDYSLNAVCLQHYTLAWCRIKWTHNSYKLASF